MASKSTADVTAPVIRYHGGKFRLARWVIEHFPPHQVYVEPFGGAASVLMQKKRAHGEVYNDLDGDVVNLFRILQGAETRAVLVEQLALTPYAWKEFELAWTATEDPVERARRTIIRAQMGFGSAGASKGTTGFRTDCARQYGTAQQLWVRYPDHLAAVGQRLAGVLIENRPAVEVMLGHDSPQTLHYVDPPYLHNTRVRAAQSGRYYRHEMNDAQHADLLQTLCSLKGMVVLSGYASELYADHLEGWTQNSIQAGISAARGGATRTECLWLNRACMNSLYRGGLLEHTA